MDSFDVDLERLRRRRTVKWTLHGPDVLAAWVAEMDFDVAPPIRAALLDAIEREDFGYVSADLSELTTVCAGFLMSEHGWEVPPTRVFPVADVLVGIRGALDVLVPQGADVVVPTPAYPPFFEIVELSGRRVVPVPMIDDVDRWTLDLDAIGAALRVGARAVLLCNPHNPTGTCAPEAELAALATIVDAHGARVIADEVHAPLVYPGHRHVPYAMVSETAAQHCVTVTSASKAWNVAGLKCAQVITSNHEDSARWRALPVFQVAGPTPLGVAAAVAAYRDGGPWLRSLREHLDGNRRALTDLLASVPSITYRPPDATYFAWLDCTGLGVDDPAELFLRRARVALSDGAPFGPGSEQRVRLNFATSRALLERIVDAMATAVRTVEGDG